MCGILVKGTQLAVGGIWYIYERLSKRPVIY